MRLIKLQPVRENNCLVGWVARFTDEVGQARIANLGLGSILDPSAFAEAVGRQGVRYISPCGVDQTAWRLVIRELTVWEPRKAG